MHRVSLKPHFNLFPKCRRSVHTTPVVAGARFDPQAIERPSDDVDVCIVGAGPAGLSAAIRLKQLERERGREIRVVVLEKGGEVGAHILSGAVIEPRALNELIPSWNSHPSNPLTQPATSSRMLFLTASRAIPIPHPPQMTNKGNYVASLSAFTRWLATVAEEEYGVEIYPGFAGARLLLSDEPDAQDIWEGGRVRSVRGVVTNEVGIARDGTMKQAFEPGMEFRARVTLLAEGAHGSLSKMAIAKYDLRRKAEPQTYAIGLKEVWRVSKDKYKAGETIHTIGWPLGTEPYGGGWVYHMEDGLVSLGLVVGLDYKNPYLEPYRELQKMKHHPYFRSLLSGAERLAYGARSLTEGGLQSLPRLSFPGGALLGCSAGMVNVAKIKGTHNAMKSGMVAAEVAYDAVHGASSSTTETTEESTSQDAPGDMTPYDAAFKQSWIYKDLHEVRNLRPSFNTRLGLWGGVAYSGVDSLFLKGRVPWTFAHQKHGSKLENGRSLDASHTDPAAMHQPRDYPSFEAPLSTDVLTSLALTGTNHAEDQLIHLRVATLPEFIHELEEGNPSEVEGAPVAGATADGTNIRDVKERRKNHVKANIETYAGLLGHACPAGVYEYVDAEGEEEDACGKKLVINSQNCIHCKLCDIKVPTQDITWSVPEGGGGPKYSVT